MPPSPPSPLQSRTRRLEEALAEGQERQSQMLELWARKLGRLPTERERRKWERQLERQLEREAKKALRRERAREENEQNVVMGWVFATMALVLVGMAISRMSTLWWLVFVALGMGSSAARILGRSWQRRAREAPPVPEAQAVTADRELPPARTSSLGDVRVERVEALCGKLLAELRAGPGLLREVVSQPEQTVEALRRSCLELLRREHELRGLCSAEDEQRLEAERAQLLQRIEAQHDAVVKERLEGALRALNEQRGQRAELATAAARLEAEYMRLYYTLENLYTQVLRVRAADSASADVAGAGLRRSVEQLGVEMDAVAEALEEVHQGPMADRKPLSGR